MKAQRKVEIQKKIAILNMRVESNNPYLKNILKDYIDGKLDRYFSNGELNDLREYLISLNLIDKNNNPTPNGRSALKSGKILIPERGIYKISLINDPVVGKLTIEFERMEPKDAQEELKEHGEIEDFVYYDNFENEEYVDLRTNKKFRFEFEKIRKEYPKVVTYDSEYATLELKCEDYDKPCEWALKIDEKVKALEGKIKVLMDDTLEEWFDGYIRELRGIAVKFNDFKNSRPTLEKFARTYSDIKKPIQFFEIEDDNEWDATVTMRLLPRDSDEAYMWISYLLNLELPSNAYFSRRQIDENVIKILNKSPIGEAISKEFEDYENWIFPTDKYMMDLAEEWDIKYNRIKATEDLLFDGVFEEEEQKSVIVVDGSNVAWNVGSKEKGDIPYAKNIEIMIRDLKQKYGFKDVVVFVDANLKYLVPDKDIYNNLESNKKIIPVPARTMADYYIIEYALRYNTYIVTGDKYRDWQERAKIYGWTGLSKDILKKFKIANDDAEVYELER